MDKGDAVLSVAFNEVDGVHITLREIFQNFSLALWSSWLNYLLSMPDLLW